VRGKAVDARRAHKHRFLQENSETLQRIADDHPSPERTLEDEEMLSLAWDQLQEGLSDCNFQILQMRLVEQRSVAEVAEALGLSHEQVWYRYHRARREVEALGAAWTRGKMTSLRERKEKGQGPAQGTGYSAVSRSVGPSFLRRRGGHCVDYVFQRLELGRRESNPEWKVEWNCDALPRPVLYIRKMAIVAYAEICGPGDFISAHWPRIVTAAIAAGVAAGLATIIATPTAALPIFQTEFRKHFQGKANSAVEDKIWVALSAKHEAHGPWCECKD
jgi:hypothetical protein